MAYKNLVINPPKYPNTDPHKESQFYKGFSTVNNSSDVRLFDRELVKQNLINQLNTKKGERVMNPEFGTIIWNLIFEPLTDALKEAIQEDLNRIFSSDPRITPTAVMIVEKDYGLLIEATLVYSNSDQTETVMFNFDKSLGLTVK